MQQLRYLYLLIMTLVLAPMTTKAQFAHGGYTTSMGGGVATGGNFSSAVVAGDPSASASVANGDTKAVYPGFIPGNFILLSFGLTKDSTVLAILYKATKGDEWINKAEWLTNADINSWNGVTIEDQRVTAIDLSGNNLQGSLPVALNNLVKLQSLNVSNNELRSVPDLSGLVALTSLDVSRNRLSFKDLIVNLDTGLATYNYGPQKRYGITQNDTVQAGEDFTLTSSIPGEGNTYQWIFDDFGHAQDSVAVTGATSTSLLVDSVVYDKMGAYRLVASNSKLPDLQIQTRNRNLWATTSLTGTVFADGDGTPLSAGQVTIFRVNDGPFILTDSTEVATDGTYLVENLVLGDFIVKSDPDLTVWPDVIQTYYVSTEDWVNADTLVVRSVVDNIDLQMVFRPEPEVDPLGGTINGQVETDLADPVDEESAGRVEARRKVKKAGCSLRRRTRSGGGRGEQDEFTLFAYVESDDEGQFTFPEIPEGVYRLNIQYPGVPMDETSDVEFTIGGDVQEQVFQVSATITEDGIVVKSKEVLSVPKPFIKDVNLYPNPTQGLLVADYTVNRKIDDLKLELRTIQGAKIAEQVLESRMGAYRAELNLTHYKSGVYFLMFTNSAGTFTHQVRVIKQ